MRNIKIVITIILVITSIITLGIVMGTYDYRNIKLGIEPRFMIRISDSSKTTQYYLGLGYMMKREVGVSYKEPLATDDSVKFGLWIYTWNVDIDSSEPEDLFLKLNGQTIKANIGSYCWAKKGMGKCVDKISPTDMEYAETLNISTNELIYYNLNESSITKIDIYSDDILLNDNVSYTPNSIFLYDLKGEYIMVIYFESEYGNGSYSVKIRLV